LFQISLQQAKPNSTKFVFVTKPVSLSVAYPGIFSGGGGFNPGIFTGGSKNSVEDTGQREW
jgi:hypothetical protein